MQVTRNVTESTMSTATLSLYGVGQEGDGGGRTGEARGPRGHKEGQETTTQGNTLVTYTAFWISST